MDNRHVYIRPLTPHLNGKVERSHRVDDQESYQLLDKDGITEDIHLFDEKLREWEDYYNYHRPHGALDGQTPYERLIAKTRAGTSPASQYLTNQSVVPDVLRSPTSTIERAAEVLRSSAFRLSSNRSIAELVLPESPGPSVDTRGADGRFASGPPQSACSAGGGAETG